jgi:hypothetical protein
MLWRRARADSLRVGQRSARLVGLGRQRNRFDVRVIWPGAVSGGVERRARSIGYNVTEGWGPQMKGDRYVRLARTFSARPLRHKLSPPREMIVGGACVVAMIPSSQIARRLEERDDGPSRRPRRRARSPDAAPSPLPDLARAARRRKHCATATRVADGGKPEPARRTSSSGARRQMGRY